MKSILIILGLFFLISTNVNAQQAVGIRGLYVVGGSLTYKVFVHNRAAVEVIGSFYQKRDFDVAVLYEWHRYFGDSHNFSYYYGLGGHTNLRVSTLAAVGVLGLDYHFSNIPLNLSLDWIPTILRLKRGDDYWFDGGGLAIRYMF